MVGATITLDERGIGKILHALDGNSCAFYAETYKDGKSHPQAGAIELLSDGSPRKIDVGTLFGYGSLQKTLFINVALFRIIDGDILINAKKRRIMKDSWNRGALKVLNKLREEDGLDPLPEPKGRSVTILQMLTHINAFTCSQQHLIGPDGSFLMCEDTFSQVLSHLVEAEGRDHITDYHYSNWNYIVAALIVRHATGKPLSEALKEHVLKNEDKDLELDNTVIDEEAFHLKQGSIATPFITTPKGTSKVPVRHYLRDDLELAVGGGYSCVEDVAKLLRFLMKAYTKDDVLTKTRFFKSDVLLKGEDADGQSFLSGLRVSLDSDAAGSESVEQALFGNYYKLGTRRGQSVDVIMKAGTVRGYSCRYYIVPKGRLFVVVMTNSSGVVDPSLHIGQHILQELLGLDAPVDIESKASHILGKQRRVAETCTAGLFPSLEFGAREITGLQATYIDDMTSAQMTITPLGTNTLGVKFEDCRSARKCTTVMRLVKIADDVLAVTPDPNQVAVDFSTVWRDFALKIEQWDGDTVKSLRQVSARSATHREKVPEEGYKWFFTREGL